MSDMPQGDETLAVFTTDKNLQKQLFDFLKAQPEVAENSTLIVIGYDERRRAIECLAREVNVDTDGDEPFIDDPDFMSNLADEIEEAALEQIKEKQ